MNSPTSSPDPAPTDPVPAWRRLWAAYQRLRGSPWFTALAGTPRHRFTDSDWLRLDTLPDISPVLITGGLVNLVMICGLLASSVPVHHHAEVFVLLLAPSLLSWPFFKQLWRRPTTGRLYGSIVGLTPIVILVVVLAKVFGPHWVDDDHLAVFLHDINVRVLVLILTMAYAMSILTIWRNEFLADWLHDQALYERNQALAHHLSSAQIQPHFLFNSLASLQHWVDQSDPRASPMLKSLTGYLRATLPLFDRTSLKVGEEMEAVVRYLEVMQARLGRKLSYSCELSEASREASLPPGVLLTLVENAVEHGVQAQLSGGEVRIEARFDATDGLVLDVMDNGMGPPPGQAEHRVEHDLVSAEQERQGGVGLRNSRWRLHQAFGDRASLKLLPRDEGGCCARIQVRP
ncbi:MAG: hypothetical protein E6Q92_10385 [Burkholderiaceae bacterium]|nr:MAG: hypothetical protein E6Q92_10385 [Burkholderiaceae bacterium]